MSDFNSAVMAIGTLVDTSQAYKNLYVGKGFVEVSAHATVMDEFFIGFGWGVRVTDQKKTGSSQRLQAEAKLKGAVTETEPRRMPGR